MCHDCLCGDAQHAQQSTARMTDAGVGEKADVMCRAARAAQRCNDEGELERRRKQQVGTHVTGAADGAD